ncbi:MAG: hypothetical protein E6Q97_27830 [Desulfurellales bacterium]|nr:MAG: hypothetical protein E6Q97_27830 [Desulfurellales bacterium]
MCSTVALETALRACFRKAEGVDCVAIAVDTSSFFSGGVIPCPPEPAATRLQRAIYDNRVLLDFATEGDGAGITCDGITSPEQWLQTLLAAGDVGTDVTKVQAWGISGTTDCPSDCDDDGVGLTERFIGSLRYVEEEPFPRLAMVDVAWSDTIDCDDTAPIETLLRSAFVRQSDGLWALRIVIEA